MKRIAVAMAAALLLSGCSIPVLEYPYLPQEPPITEPSVLTLLLPDDADDLLQGAMTTLEAKVLELGDNQLNISVQTAGDMLESYQQGEAGLYLLTSGQMAQLDRQLAFASMPFLFSGSEKLLAVLNNQNGPIYSSSTVRQNLGGEVLGVYYRGTTLLLSANKYFDELGLYGAAGVLETLGASDGFIGLGVEEQLEGGQQELLEAFAEGTVKLCEIRPDTVIPPEAQELLKSIEFTEHRHDCWWLVLRGSDGLDSRTINILKEAFAYTRQQYDTGRATLEAQQLDGFLRQYGELLQERDGYAATRKQARSYYRENWEQLGIPEEIWDKTLELS